MQFNIDGATMPHTPNEELWPILCQIIDGNTRPFAVAVYLGRRKPSSIAEYLQDFIEELRRLLHSGIVINRRKHEIRLHSFICDAPARAMLKCIKYHSGYYSCERCTIRGEMVKSTMVFITDGNEELRNDNDFSRFAYSGRDDQNIRQHQLSQSPLAHLIPCVSRFVLDSMHIAYIGVMKRLIQFWKDSPSFRGCQLSNQQQEIVNSKLRALRGKLPSEFARQPSAFDTLDNWKATDYRAFALYIGPFVMKEVLSEEHFKHFVAFSVGLYILNDENSENRTRFLEYASKLIEYFIDDSEKLYSSAFVTYNVHALSHLQQDVKYFNCSLSKMTAFPFESFLSYVKDRIRSARRPIVQIVNRLKELDHIKHVPMKTKSPITISTKLADSCFFISNSTIAVVVECTQNESIVKKIPIDQLEDCFDCGIPSTKLKIGSITSSVLLRAKKAKISNAMLVHKAIILPQESGYCIWPLLHNE